MNDQLQAAYWYPGTQEPSRCDFGWEIRPWELECERMPPPQPGEVERWVQELMEDSELGAAEDLLEKAVPSANPWVFGAADTEPSSPSEPYDDLYIWSDGPREPPPQIIRDTPIWSREPEPERGQEKTGGVWKTVSNAVFYAVLALIVVGAVIFSDQSNGRPFFGFSYFEVLSGSMESVIPRGSLVIAQHVPAAGIRPGDIVTFINSNEESITHGVLRVIPNFDGNGTLGFQTKGTDNPLPDEDIVGAGNVIGVVKLHVKGLGFPLRYVKDNIRYVFLFSILILLASIAVRVFLAERKKETEEDEMGEEEGEKKRRFAPERAPRGSLGLASPGRVVAIQS